MKDENQHRPVLLVEDNPVDLDLMLRALGKGGMLNPIEVARDGEEALSWISRWEQDELLPIVILLDLNLPKIQGLEVLKTLREHPLGKTIPVVVLTSSNEDKDINAAYALHANSYIVKPVNFENFMKVASQIELYWAFINQPALTH